MKDLERLPAGLAHSFLALFASAILLGACNDVLGFQEGKPYPADTATRDATVGADVASQGADAGQGVEASITAGDVNESDGGCASGDRSCGGSCVPPAGCCASNECPSGESCVEHVCACNEGTKRCGTQCILANDCCDSRDCPVGGSCQGGQCSCPSGAHNCDDVCVSNIDVKTCGISCTACTPPVGGEAACDGTKCGAACPSGQKLCAGSCIPTQSACMNQCPAMTHDCDGACAPNDSVNSCGSSCSPCVVPSSGQATCDGTNCGIQCNPTFKRCGNQCIPASACCTTAECPANSTCSGNQCQCAANFKLCGGACIPASACCTDGECQANAACIANQCQCKSTFKDCGGTCIPSGSCCTNADCPNGYQCSGNTCQCQLPNLVCQGKCLNGGTDANNCGACGHVCALGCAASQCRCLISDGNLLVNGGFDSDISAWSSTSTGTTRSADDAVNCGTSGSMRLITSRATGGAVETLQSLGDYVLSCVDAVTAPGVYNYGAMVRLRPGSPPALIQFFAELLTVGCSSPSNSGGGQTTAISLTNDWTPIRAQFTSTAPAIVALMEFVIGGGDGTSVSADVEIDNIYIARDPSQGWR